MQDTMAETPDNAEHQQQAEIAVQEYGE